MTFGAVLVLIMLSYVLFFLCGKLFPCVKRPFGVIGSIALLILFVLVLSIFASGKFRCGVWNHYRTFVNIIIVLNIFAGMFQVTGLSFMIMFVCILEALVTVCCFYVTNLTFKEIPYISCLQVRYKKKKLYLHDESGDTYICSDQKDIRECKKLILVPKESVNELYKSTNE